MFALGILFCLAGIILKFVVVFRRCQMMAADTENGMTWLAAWRKHAWYQAEDIPWMLLLIVGLVLMWKASSA